MARVTTRLQELGVSVVIEDRSELPCAEPLLAGGTSNIDLRPYQIEAMEAAIAAKRGVLESATGTGKTECLGAWIRRLACRTLIIVNSRDLAHQTIERFESGLTFPNAPRNGLYGLVGDNTWSPGLITLAMYQTLHQRLQQEPEETREWLASFDAMALDEAHHAPAKTFWDVINACPAYWRLGLSATPFKSDIITELKLVGSTGEIFYSFKAKEAVEAGWLTKPFVITVDPQFSALVDEELYMDSYRDGVVEHVKRNRLIAKIAQGTAEKWDTPTLILVQWVEHGRNIKRALREIGMRVEFIYGGTPTEQRREAMQALGDGRSKCLISSTIMDEGIDIPEIGALILAGAGKARHKVLQRIGRGLRVIPGKDYLAVFDFLDSHSEKYLLSHGRQRLQAVKDAEFDQETLTPTELFNRMDSGDIRH